MAIVFISIQKKQRIFFWGISLVLVLAMGAISFALIIPEFNDSPDIAVQEVFSAPDVKINFDVVDSLQVKNLELFSDSQIGGTITAGRQNPFLPSSSLNNK